MKFHYIFIKITQLDVKPNLEQIWNLTTSLHNPFPWLVPKAFKGNTPTWFMKILETPGWVEVGIARTSSLWLPAGSRISRVRDSYELSFSSWPSTRARCFCLSPAWQNDGLNTPARKNVACGSHGRQLLLIRALFALLRNRHVVDGYPYVSSIDKLFMPNPINHCKT